MNAAAATAAGLSGLADIELPAPPDWQPWLLVGLALPVVVVIAVYLVAGRRRGTSGIRPQQPESLREQARQRLESLHRNWQAGTIDDRETGYRLCAVLRIGLGLRQLRNAPPPAAVEPEYWQRTIEELRRVRYDRDAPALNPALFERARQWLSRPADAGIPAADG